MIKTYLTNDDNMPIMNEEKKGDDDHNKYK